MASGKAVKEYMNQVEEMQMTSLIDMSFLLLIFFMCLPFRSLDHKLECALPREGIIPIDAPPKDTVRIRVRMRGNELVYALGERTASSAEGLKPVLRALGPLYAYEIDATPDIPWAGVVDAVNVLRAVDCPDVRFRGGPRPDHETRRRVR